MNSLTVVTDWDKVKVEVYAPEAEEESLRTIRYKNNDGKTAKTNDNNKSKLWSKLKSLWS